MELTKIDVVEQNYSKSLRLRIEEIKNVNQLYTVPYVESNDRT
jgi:hypothetical protein